MEGREERFCDVGGGISLCYDDFGDPSGTPLLLIMGLATQMIAWHEDFCGELAGRGFHVVRFDNRDMGRSTHMDFRPPTPGQMLRRRSVRGPVHAQRHGRRRRGPASRAGHGAGPRRRRLDGRHDRPDAGRRAPGAGPLADLDHVHHRQPLARAALPRALPVPAEAPADRSRGHGRSTPPRSSGWSAPPASKTTPSTSATTSRAAMTAATTSAGGARQLGAIIASGDRTRQLAGDQDADAGHPRHRRPPGPPIGRQGHRPRHPRRPADAGRGHGP